MQDDLSSESLRAAFRAGLQFDLQPKDVLINRYDDAAVLTNLYEGTTTLPSGRVDSLESRSTSVWIKTDKGWRIVIMHDSHLIQVE